MWKEEEVAIAGCAAVDQLDVHITTQIIPHISKKILASAVHRWRWGLGATPAAIHILQCLFSPRLRPIKSSREAGVVSTLFVAILPPVLGSCLTSPELANAGAVMHHCWTTLATSSFSRDWSPSLTIEARLLDSRYRSLSKSTLTSRREGGPMPVVPRGRGRNVGRKGGEAGPPPVYCAVEIYLSTRSDCSLLLQIADCVHIIACVRQLPKPRLHLDLTDSDRHDCLAQCEPGLV